MKQANNHVQEYEKALALCSSDYQEFWGHEAKRLLWTKDFFKVHDGKFAQGQWFLGGELNASVNCLDRHVADGNGHNSAIIFEDESYQTKIYTYHDLLKLTKNIAAILYNKGIRTGDRVVIYMPVIPEGIAAMLACARLGAIHTVVFAGFAKDALADRIHDAEAKAIITVKETQRKGRALLLGHIISEVLEDERCNSVSTVLCFGLKTPTHDRVIPYEEQTNFPAAVENPLGFKSEHPLFILYTSGTTGKPKGIIHGTAGYLTQVVSTTAWAFDLGDKDIFWSTADIGWITGHSYGVYGPLSLGKTIFIYNGALNWPDASRIYDIIERHKISVLYTAPTAIRLFMREGEKIKNDFDLSSLRLLGSVGEPINPEAWHWYARVFGQNRCPVIDTWWQTETGAMMITAIPDIHTPKPGSASKPFLGIKAEIIDEHGQKVLANQAGYLVIKSPWPSLAQGIWRDDERFLDTYFAKIPGVYFTGDSAKIDNEGDFFINGRIDDVINVSGHRLGTAEVESVLVAHESVAEAAVIGIPDDITGQRLVAFVLLMQDTKKSEHLATLLKNHVKEHIGAFARPAEIHFETNLPKTRSGKIMRRLLRAKAQGEIITSDLSTLDDTSF